MKHLLLTTIAAVVLVGCGPSVDIHEAVSKGNIEAVKQHIAAGTDVNAKDVKGKTPLYIATIYGHKEIGELVITNGADVNAKSGRKEFTALYWAIFRGRREFTELLIAKGADVNLGIKDGTTPLHQAASRGQKEIVELLIAKGADVNAQTDARLTPLHYVGGSAVGSMEVAELLIANGADVSAKNEEGWTALHFAVSGGHNEVAELLIAKGVDVNAKDDDGETPLDGATHPNNPNASAEIVDLLRKHGGKTGEELKAEGR